MSIDTAIKKWLSKKRKMGCVAAANWFCKRVPDFKPERLTRYTKKGEIFEHVVCTFGYIRIDLLSKNDRPDNE